MAETVFYLQSEHKLEISANGTSGWMRVAAGIKSFEPEGNEQVDQSSYLDGDETDITGGQLVLKLSGHRAVGDAAQDWIFDRQFTYGASRRGFARWTLPGGTVQFTFPCTIANIKGASGEANQKGEIEFEIHANATLTKNTTVASVTKTNKELATEKTGKA